MAHPFHGPHDMVKSHCLILQFKKQNSETRIHLILQREREQDTDLCLVVFVNSHLSHSLHVVTPRDIGLFEYGVQIQTAPPLKQILGNHLFFQQETLKNKQKD